MARAACLPRSDRTSPTHTLRPACIFNQFRLSLPLPEGLSPTQFLRCFSVDAGNHTIVLLVPLLCSVVMAEKLMGHELDAALSMGMGQMAVAQYHVDRLIASDVRN